MGRKSSVVVQQPQQQQQQLDQRPKRRATNAHIFRYLQTRNPTKLEEDDLKRALEASLEECPDFWPEDSASCSSSEQSNANSAPSSASSSGSGVGLSSSNNHRKSCCNSNKKNKNINTTKRRAKSMQPNHLKHLHNHQSYMHNPYHHLTTHNSTQNNNNNNTLTANSNCCPQSSNVHNRYKPVAKKNIYNEADFFHEGIMEYIDYFLHKKMKKPIEYRY